ncbi:MAG: type II toxin-antitoxin system prevent-host-death family antitoxin [Fimbriimonadaceae bacterium]|nr:type II toxin-antitoxin system prevent-host-death family antitoxin [Fimbriimonadaceae bacterium]
MKIVAADEAEARFARILTEVRAGESYTITLDGEPVAILGPVAEPLSRRDELRAAIGRLIEFGQSHPCPREELKGLIEEGRRF